MFDENQIVQVKWNNTNKDWYEAKGYIYTKRYDAVDVLAKDLSPRSNVKIKAICDYCGAEYGTSFVVLMDGRKLLNKDACCHCASIKANQMNHRRRAIKQISLAERICQRYGYRLLTSVDEYVDVKMNIRFLCLKHGEQRMMLDNLLSGHKCLRCSYEERGDGLKHDKVYVKQIIEGVNGNILLNPDDYDDTFTRNLRIRCSCGREFVTSFSNYTRANVNKCFSCSCKESAGEKRIRELLEANGVEYVQEKRFEDCRDVKPLPFDFYLPQYNLIIEFDGLHHYEENGFKNHQSTKKHDEIKNQYCQSHNIDLLRIPYWDGNLIEQIICDKLGL